MALFPTWPLPSYPVYQREFPVRKIKLFLLLVFAAAQDGHVAVLELALQVFVHGEGDGLAGRHAHDARRDSLVESVESFLPMRGRGSH